MDSIQQKYEHNVQCICYHCFNHSIIYEVSLSCYGNVVVIVFVCQYGYYTAFGIVSYRIQNQHKYTQRKLNWATHTNKRSFTINTRLAAECVFDFVFLFSLLFQLHGIPFKTLLFSLRCDFDVDKITKKLHYFTAVGG